MQGPAVLFLDELDGLAPSRDGAGGGAAGDAAGDGASRRLLSELLVLLTEFCGDAGDAHDEGGALATGAGPSGSPSPPGGGGRQGGAGAQPAASLLPARPPPQWSGLATPRHHLLVVGATNRVADLDPALLRRFDAKVGAPGAGAVESGRGLGATQLHVRGPNSQC